jgi:alpha-L-fucosidase
MAAASGNYLLNVGPAPDGTIPEDQATVMCAIGDWLARNGESVYATQAGPKLTDGTIRCTRRGNTLYLHCLEWPAVNRIPLPTVLPEGVKEAVLMTTGAALEVVETADGSELRGLPAIPPDPLINVIRVEFYRAPKLFSAGALKVVDPVVVTVPSYAPTRLLPEKAEFEGLGVKGAKLRVRRNAAGGQFISGWMVPDHAAHWNLNVEREGRYSISAIVGAPATHAGAVIKVVAGDTEFTFTAPETATLDAVKTVQVGKVELPAGHGRITVRPEKLKWGYLSADIAELVLTPVA